MMFRWHYALWLLLAVPAAVAAYLVLLQRRNQHALRYAGLVRDAPGSRFARWTPAALLVAGLSALLLSVARPVVTFTKPSEHGTVILLMDVSLSMAASDVAPTRLEAARAAAKAFVNAQPRDVRIGIVAFGGHADVVQPPTGNRRDVIAALDRLELQRFTGIGNGLIGALLTLMPTAYLQHGYDIFGMGQVPAGYEPAYAQGQPLVSRPRKPSPPGSHLSAAIVLVSDGCGTMGVPAATAAKIVADFGVRVFTVGVGTLYGGTATIEGWPPIHAEFSEEALQEIARITRGEYYLSRTAEKLTRIYEKLGRQVVVERTELEITALVTALGMVLALASAGLSVAGSVRAR